MQNQHLDTVQILYDNGANVNIVDSNNITPINVAAQLKSPEILRKLLEFGADPEIASLDLSETPLFTAVGFDNLECVQALIESNVDINARSSKNETPLHVACKHGFFDVAKLLIDNNAEINPQNNEKITPLHFATLQKNKELVQYLLDHGADPLMRNDSGKSPFSMATPEISNLLRQAVIEITHEKVEQRKQEIEEKREQRRQQREQEQQQFVEEEEQNEVQQHEEEEIQDNASQHTENTEHNQQQEIESIHEEEEIIESHSRRAASDLYTPSHSRTSISETNESRKNIDHDRPLGVVARSEFAEFEKEIQDELRSFKGIVDKQVKEMTKDLLELRKIFVNNKRNQTKSLSEFQ